MNQRNDRSIGRWSWALLLLLCLFLAVAVSGNAQTNEPSSMSSLTNINEKAKSLQDNFAKLETLWREQKIAFTEALQLNSLLKNELSALKDELSEVTSSLQNSILSSEESQQEVARLTIFFEQLEETSQRLSTNFQEYRQTAEQQIRRLNIERWVYRVVIGILASVATWFGLQ